MILPTELAPIAKLAYQRFVKTANPAVRWEDLNASKQAEWKDLIFAADKMRKYETLEIWADDCCLQAIREYEKRKTTPQLVPAAETVITKPKKASKEK